MESITIRNFQAHEKTKVEFDKKITTIVGPSDAGKSAVLRALRWVMTNKPSGNAFLRHETKRCRVALTVDGHKIVREKGDRNTYALDNEPYKAFGNDVPQGIVQLLNIDELNFQSQHDAPFWFSSTAGEVGRELNQIIDLGLIDSTLSNVNSALRTAKAEVEISKQRESTAKKERAELLYAKELATEFKHIESLHRTLLDASKRREQCETLSERANKHLRALADLCEECEDMEHVEALGNDWTTSATSRENLTKYLTLIEKIQKKVERGCPDITSITSLAETYEETSENRRALIETLTTLSDMEIVICEKSKDLEEMEEDFHEQIGTTCPLCNNTIR